MVVSIDTNILIDILVQDPIYCKHSEERLSQYAHESLTICPIVRGELLVLFLRKFGEQQAALEIEQFLREFGIKVSEFIADDYSAAAHAWQRWLDKRKPGVECPACGRINAVRCSACKTRLQWRNHMIADFLIGAHAQRTSDVLLTRDRGFYKLFRVTLA